jgi:hypothetical protein
VFVGLGSAASAIALTVGTGTAYLIAMVVAALFVLLSAIPLHRLPEPVVAVEHRERAGRSPLTDRRYLAVAALNGVITMQFGLLTVGMPLWVTRHTPAPAATVALLLVLNTTLVALLQVRAARRVTDVPAAGRAVLGATLLLLLACLLYAAAGSAGGPVVAAAVLVLAVLAHSGGEIISEAGGWELSFELADPHNAGAYQGVSQTGFAVGGMLAPAVVTATAISHGPPGWLLLGGLFVAAGAGTRAVSGRSLVKVG